MEELATLRTAIIITVFITESRPWILASEIAIIKGDALLSILSRPNNRGSLYGTSKPTMPIATM